VLKGKMLFGLAMMVGILAVSAAPAAAQWETTNGGQIKGPAHAGNGAFEGGGGTVSCESAQGIWKASLPQKTQQSKLISSIKLHVTRWNTCKTAPFGTTAAISQCEFELKQPQKGEQIIVGSLLSPHCTVEADTVFFGICVITFQSQNNQNLGKISLSNSGANQIDKVEITGITTTVNKNCETGGIKATKEGKLKTEFTLEGLNAV
jgi:hypothetical protein